MIVRGARILATLAPFADELAVYPGHPLPPDTEAYALAFCIPMATPGLKFICRDSYAGSRNLFDHPLSARFDEQDAFVIFDDVEVPWDRVHINCNVAVYNQVMATGWFPNVMQQTMIRAQTKLEFAWGLATRMTEAINDKAPITLQMLGELWTFSEFARACVESAERNAFEFGNGVWFPHGAPLTALRATLPFWFPRVNEIIRLLGSHNLLAAPTAAQLADPDVAAVDRSVHARRRRCHGGTARADLSSRVGFFRQRARESRRAVRTFLPRVGRAQSRTGASRRQPRPRESAGGSFPRRICDALIDFNPNVRGGDHVGIDRPA